MPGQVDGVGDQRRRRIGRRRVLRQHGHRIGDAQRKAAAAPAAGGDAAHRIGGADDEAVGKAVAGAGDRRARLVAGRKMDRDVAAIVDIGFVEFGRVTIAAMISSATEPATAAIGVMNSGWNFWTAAPCAAPSGRRSGAARHRPACAARAARRPVLRGSSGSARRRCSIGGAALRLAAERLDDQVDRAMVEMQPLAVGEPGDLRAVHDSAPRTRPISRRNGHGLPDGAGADRRSFRYSPPLWSTSSSERIASA